MTVALILAGKGREVVTLRPDQTLATAAQTLSRHRIGASVVTDGADGVLGIISERDVVRAVAESGGAALDEPVSQRMTSKVVTCTAASGIDELLGLMTDGKFRHIPVVEGGRLTGIVSIGDIVKHRLAEVVSEHQALRDYIATA
jgi:CBS domain-containing protein